MYLITILCFNAGIGARNLDAMDEYIHIYIYIYLFMHKNAIGHDSLFFANMCYHSISNIYNSK